MDNLLYIFSAEIRLWKGEKAVWTFITLPQDESAHLRFFAEGWARGFRSVKVEARIGKTSWQTSLFPSKEHGGYLLPVKKSVRAAENISHGDIVETHVQILD